MSSHDMSVRAALKVKPTVTLQVVWVALTPFLDEFEIALEVDALFGETGEMPLEDPDDSIILDQDGNLFLTLSCHGSAGTYPNELDSLCKALDGLVDGGGAIEIVDHDTSAGNEDAIGVRFVGADDKQRIFARLDYGFGLAKDWLVDVIGPGDFEALVATARTAAVKRFGDS